jgi:SAM-dependent methyltransferase
MAGKFPPDQVRLTIAAHAEQVGRFVPNTEGYGRLATVWDDYAGWFVPDYAQFLSSAGDYYGVAIESLLDLGCGTGLLSRQLARRVKKVIGLDASELMLRQARRLTEDPNVRFVQGDFRNFDLRETFDAVVCGSDSLNYVETPDQLAKAFHCVQRHLAPAGIFAFDVLDHRACMARAGQMFIVGIGDERFVYYPFYDPDTRISEDRVVFRGEIERHRRMAIEERDVQRAAGEAGLEVAEHFTHGGFFGRAPGRQFYLLRKPPQRS